MRPLFPKDYRNDVTLNNVELILGIPRIESVHKIVANIINNNLNEAIDIYNSIKLECEDSIQIYDNIIDVVINHSIYINTGSLRSTNIPESFKSFIINDYNKLKLFLNRLIKFRIFANQSNADNLLKTIFIEMTSEE